MPKELKQILNKWDSIAIIIAIVIGVGIFRVPAEVARYLHSPKIILLAWFVGGLIVLLGALCYGELSSSFPKTGGNYIYLKEAYGPGMGFLFGWAELLVIHTGSVAAVSFVAAEYLRKFLGITTNLVKPIAICIVLIVSLVNILGLRYGKKIQNTLTAAKILAVVAIIAFGFLLQKGDISNFQKVSVGVGACSLSMFALALIPILWAYGGWHENTFLSGETKNPTRTIPFALIAGVSLVILLYLAINFLYMYMVPVSKISGMPLIASEVLSRLSGASGAKILDLLIVIFSLGTINAMVITGSRITYAMSIDNPIFSYIGSINNKYATPHRAIALAAGWSIILIAWGSFHKLLFFTGILVWLFFALAVFGIFILRRKFPNIQRPYKVWGYPVVPFAFILICIGLFINTLISYPTQSIVGLLILLSGLPIYLFSKKLKGAKL